MDLLPVSAMSRPAKKQDIKTENISLILAGLVERLSLKTIFYVIMASQYYFCIDNNLNYSFEEGNFKILRAYVLKDNTCGTSHTITQFLPTTSSKREVDACVDSILATDCERWKISNPTPIPCLGINTGARRK